MSSVSNGLYFLTLPLVSVMRVIYQKIRHARYLSKNTSCALSIHQKECRKSLGCALYIRCALSIEKYGKFTLLICAYVVYNKHLLFNMHGMNIKVHNITI